MNAGSQSAQSASPHVVVIGGAASHELIQDVVNAMRPLCWRGVIADARGATWAQLAAESRQGAQAAAPVWLLPLVEPALWRDAGVETRFFRQLLARERAGEWTIAPVLWRPAPWPDPAWGRLRAIPEQGSSIAPRLGYSAALAWIQEALRLRLREDRSLSLGRSDGVEQGGGGAGMSQDPPEQRFPAARPLNFVANEELMAVMDAAMAQHAHVILSPPEGAEAAHGWGAATLALEYLYRFRQRHAGVVWQTPGEALDLARQRRQVDPRALWVGDAAFTAQAGDAQRLTLWRSVEPPLETLAGCVVRLPSWSLNVRLAALRLWSGQRPGPGLRAVAEWADGWPLLTTLLGAAVRVRRIAPMKLLSLLDVAHAVGLQAKLRAYYACMRLWLEQERPHSARVWALLCAQWRSSGAPEQDAVRQRFGLDADAQIGLLQALGWVRIIRQRCVGQQALLALAQEDTN
ncbi:hypothetical protein [Magnetofaba australis]|uniref:Uncharacterized protein n=1 Tax=Magnetofaba australis IT-1 TaxID=1434232 RepID=A0A1Y2K915_9PROT|nr:hypothetical protein [Magnetofaba australis]OSM05275.1 hypothetical protein MAIT1_03443 [Magnetofaba australis IT-1]